MPHVIDASRTIFQGIIVGRVRPGNGTLGSSFIFAEWQTYAEMATLGSSGYTNGTLGFSLCGDDSLGDLIHG